MGEETISKIKLQSKAIFWDGINSLCMNTDCGWECVGTSRTIFVFSLLILCHIFFN